MLGERALGGGCSLDRVTSPRERDEEGLGLAIDDYAAVLVERLFEQAAVLCHHLLVALAEVMLKLVDPSISVKRRVTVP